MRFPWYLLSADSRPGNGPASRDWDENLALAGQHGLEGWIYSRWKTHLPEAPLARARSAWGEQCLRNALYLEEADRLCGLARAAGMSWVRLKGLALLETVYDDPGARCLTDMDFLVPGSGHWEHAQQLAREAGYREIPGIPPEFRRYKITFTRFEGGRELVLDLHAKLFPVEPRGHEWAHDGGRLAASDLLFHLTGHLAYQHGFTSLNWLLDIDLLSRKLSSQLDWRRVAGLSRAFRQTASLRATLWALKTYLGSPVPTELSGGHWSSALLLDEAYFWEPGRHRLRYLLAQNLLKDSWRERLENDMNWVLRRLRPNA